jgi:tetratricopeptide (TPR) repeat protein
MKLTIATSTSRVALLIAAGALALYLGYFSVRSAWATYYTDENTRYGFERAAKIEPGDARNWFLLGKYLQYGFEEEDPGRVIASYKKALEIDPRYTAAWLELAAAYEGQNDLPAARNAYLTAKKTYPGSAEVSWRYGNFLLRQDELEPAFAEIRRAVEADPNRAAEAFSRSERVEPDAEVILNRVLPANAIVYLTVMRDLTSEGEVDSALKVWNRLAAMHPQIKMQDIFLLVMRLHDAGRPQEAHRVWEQAAALTGLGPFEGAQDSVVWDGGFESDVTGDGYAWRLSSGANGTNDAGAAQISFDPRHAHSGKRSLRVSFDGSSDVDFRNGCQTVPVEAGTAYELSAWMAAKDLTTDQGVRLELKPRAGGAPAASTEQMHGTQDWTHVTTVWGGASGVQEMEICLRREPSDEEDNKIRGTVWVDDVALTPLRKSGAGQ